MLKLHTKYAQYLVKMLDTDDVLKKKISQIWDRSSETFDTRPAHGVLSEVERSAWKSQFSLLIPPSNQVSVLDVGCGTGEMSLILADIGHSVSGIDLSEGMIQAAKKKSIEKGFSIDFKCGDAEKPPFSPQSFDLIIQRHVIWTLPHPEVAVQAWYVLLKPNGKLFLIDSMLDRGMTVDPNRPPHLHYDVETADQLPFSKGLSVDKAEELLQQAGFDDITLHGIDHIRQLQMGNMTTEQKASYVNKKYYIMSGVKK